MEKRKIFEGLAEGYISYLGYQDANKDFFLKIDPEMQPAANPAVEAIKRGLINLTGNKEITDYLDEFAKNGELRLYQPFDENRTIILHDTPEIYNYFAKEQLWKD